MALNRIARRWTIRRAIVALAERTQYGEGLEFRGRLYPIYAKEVLARKATVLRMPIVLPLTPNRRKSIFDNVRWRAISRGGSGPMPIRRLDKSPGRASARSSLPSQGTFRSTLRRIAPSSAVGTKSTKHLGARGLQRGHTLSFTTKTSRTTAANNFGLHLRQEQLKGTKDDTQALAEKIDGLCTDVETLKMGMGQVLKLLQPSRSGHAPEGQATPQRLANY